MTGSFIDFGGIKNMDTPMIIINERLYKEGPWPGVPDEPCIWTAPGFPVNINYPELILNPFEEWTIIPHNKQRYGVHKYEPRSKQNKQH